jgi:hypothetical protein
VTVPSIWGSVLHCPNGEEEGGPRNSTKLPETSITIPGKMRRSGGEEPGVRRLIPLYGCSPFLPGVCTV